MATLVMNHPALHETGLFKQYSTEDFNRLKDIEESQHAQVDSAVSELAKDLRASKLQDLVGICRIHNHFHLNSDEIVQSTLGTSVNDPTIKVEQDALVIHIKPTKVAGLPEAPIPYMWAYDKKSQSFYPVQYFDGTNKRMKEHFNQLCEQRDVFTSFLKQFIQRVEITNTDKDLGVYLRYEDLIQLNKENGESLLEDTDVVGRKQWMVPRSKEMLDEIVRTKLKIDPTFNMTRTYWYFDERNTEYGTECGTHALCGHVCAYHPPGHATE